MQQSITLENLELTRFFFAIVSLLSAAHFFGYLFQRFRLPRVIGEIFGGFLLGPTLLGRFLPGAYQWLFQAFESEGKLLSIVYWLGLILLMFVSGFEIKRSLRREERRIIGAVLIGSTFLPFLSGWLAPRFFDFAPYLGTKGSLPAFRIILAIAAAVTSIPVISRIFMDLKIMSTDFAKIILSAATIHDLLLWIALAVATSLVGPQALTPATIGSTLLITISFFAISLLITPEILKWISQFRYNLLIKSSVSGYTLLICFSFAALASLLNVNIVFGALLAGIVVGMLPDERFREQKAQIKDLSLAFFTPLYFAIVGLKLDLIHHLDSHLLLGFLILSSLTAILGTTLAAKTVRRDWLSSFNLGVAMNARGGPGIVLATVAFDLGIINEVFFVTLVLTAVLTSLFSGYWLRFVLSKGWELLKAT